MIKACFFDVGNTLVSKSHGYGLSPKLRRDLLDLRRSGVSIGIMSIRSPEMVKEALPGLDFDFCISLDGSLVYERDEKVIDAPLAKLEDNWLAYYSEEGVFAKNKETREELARRGFATTGVSPLPKKAYGFVTDEGVSLGDLRKVHWENSRLNTYFKEGASKGEAIAFLAKSHGWKKEEILAFGDGPNDLEVAKSVGRFVALAGCPVPLGEEATFQTDFAWKEGVSNALRLLDLLPLNYVLFRENSSKEVGGVETHAKYFEEHFGKKGNLFVITHKGGKNVIDYENDGESHLYEELPSLLKDRPVVIFFNSGHWIEEMDEIRKAFPLATFFYRTGGNEIPSAPLRDRTIPFEKRQRYWVDTLNRNLDHLITNSYFTDRRLLDLGIKPSLLKRMSGGVPLARIKELKERKAKLRESLFPGNRVHLLCASRFVPYKRMALLLETFSLLDERYDLTLIGDGPEYGGLHERYQGNKRIRFLGKLPHEDVLPYIVGCDIYVQCSGNFVYQVPGGSYVHCEGMGRTILEAICSSTYVVATSSGAFPEFIKGKRGVIVNDNPEDIAEAIRKASYKGLKPKGIGLYDFESIFGRYESLCRPKKKIALISSKCPGVPDGGGSSMVDTLIQALGRRSEVDFYCLRTPREELKKNGLLHAYCFLPNPNRGTGKFDSRLDCIPYYKEKLNPLLREYDEIIVVHASKAFALDEENLKKTTLFPMFLTKDYLRSGEKPPKRYFEEEDRVLKGVKRIISPCRNDKEEIASAYRISPNKITIISRGIDPCFYKGSAMVSKSDERLKMLLIANIKKQKNLKEAVSIARKANERGLDVSLSICGAVDDPSLFAWLKDEMKKQPWLRYEGSLGREKLKERINGSDLLICSSYFETFGRCVYEAASSGLPSLISDRLDCFKGAFDSRSSYFYKDEEDALSFLACYASSFSLRENMAKEAKQRSLEFTKEKETKRLRGAIHLKTGLFVLGTRPEAIKMSPVIHGLEEKGIGVTIYDTCQHQGLASKILFEEGLTTEKKDFLGRGDYKAKALRFAKTLEKESPRFSFVVVQGDTLSSLAGAYYALRTNTPLYYLESGMRSFDEASPYPEEGIRKEISKIASLNFAPSKKEAENLKKEGARGVYLTGNTFQDSLLSSGLAVTEGNEVLVTLHRRENLPYLNLVFLKLRELCFAHPELAFLFPVHPNPKVKEATSVLEGIPNLALCSPLDPKDFLKMLFTCKMVITDSGGVEEEARYLGKKCLVIRKASERGQENLLSPDSVELKPCFESLLLEDSPKPDYRYGKESGAKTIVNIIEEELYEKD